MFSFLNSPVYIRKRNTNVPRFCFFGSLQCTVMSLKQRVLLLSPSEEQCKYSIYTCCIMYSICMHMVHALLQSFIILILIILAQQSYSPTYCVYTVHCTVFSICTLKNPHTGTQKIALGLEFSSRLGEVLSSLIAFQKEYSTLNLLC